MATLRLPPGTLPFAFRTWCALALALYLAFALELEGAGSAAVTVMLLAQPAQGMVLSKAIYRIAGTLVGMVAAMGISAAFPQDRTMILAAFTLWLGLCTAVGTLLRDFRAYAAVLAGYTVAIIAIADIDAPTLTFEATVNRGAAILVGIASIALVNAFFVEAESAVALRGKLAGMTREVIAVLLATLDRREPPDILTCVDIGSRLVPLRSEIAFATPELPDGGRRAQGARSALLALFEILTAIQAVGTGLGEVGHTSAVAGEVEALLRQAARLQRPERLKQPMQALVPRGLRDGSLSLAEAYLIDRAVVLLDTLGDVRDGQRAMRTGRRPRRRVGIPVHQDYVTALLNFTRVIVAVGGVCALGVVSGQAAMGSAILFTAVYVSLGSTSPAPLTLGTNALIGMPITAAVALVYEFLVFPVISGFPLLMMALAPLVFATCLLLKTRFVGYGTILGALCLALLGPSNPQVIDPESFVASAVVFIGSGILIFVSLRIVLPVQPPQRRMRLALAVGTSLRRALVDEKALGLPRASLQYDRLSQFKQWLGVGPATLAHRKTFTRLNDIGNLAFALRRSWRALDAAVPAMTADLAARARAVLPRLAPRDTDAVAREIFAAASGQTDDAARRLVHAAAGLHGVAFLTGKEARLLRRTELLERAP